VHEGDNPDESSRPSSGPDLISQCGEITVELHRCPNCGIDLPAAPSSVYICGNCHWVVSLDRLQRLTGGIGAVAQVRPDDALLPFWLFNVGRDQTARLAGPTVTPTAEFIAVPGFRLANFESARKLCQRMTAISAQLPLRPVTEDSGCLLPVTVAMGEALAMAEISLYCQLLSKNPRQSVDACRLTPRQVGLLYAPFHPEQYFYVDSALGAVTFEKSAIIPAPGAHH
jgi:ribosomal protein S27AE